MFKRNPPDYQATITFNRASLSRGLKSNIILSIVCAMGVLFLIFVSFRNNWDILPLIMASLFAVILYRVIAGYIQWRRILKTGTKIERGSNDETTKIE